MTLVDTRDRKPHACAVVTERKVTVITDAGGGVPGHTYVEMVVDGFEECP